MSDDYYVLFGHPERRRWEDARKHGFVAAGGGPRWSRPLRNLGLGDRVFVHVPQHGYVGVGIVTAPAVPAREFTVHHEGVFERLLDLPLVSRGLGLDAEDPELCEYLVAVKWEATVSTEDAYWRKGLFWRRVTTARLTDHSTAHEVTRILYGHEPVGSTD